MFKFDRFLFWLGTIASLIAIPCFFRIDAITIWNWTADMSGRAVFLALSLLILATGLFLRWRAQRVTPKNIQFKIREWLDTFNLAHRLHDFEPWHFTLVVTYNNFPIFVGRPKVLGGRYIVVQARTQGVLL